MKTLALTDSIFSDSANHLQLQRGLWFVVIRDPWSFVPQAQDSEASYGDSHGSAPQDPFIGLAPPTLLFSHFLEFVLIVSFANSGHWVAGKYFSASWKAWPAVWGDAQKCSEGNRLNDSSVSAHLRLRYSRKCLLREHHGSLGCISSPPFAETHILN